MTQAARPDVSDTQIEVGSTPPRTRRYVIPAAIAAVVGIGGIAWYTTRDRSPPLSRRRAADRPAVAPVAAPPAVPGPGAAAVPPAVAIPGAAGSGAAGSGAPSSDDGDVLPEVVMYVHFMRDGASKRRASVRIWYRINVSHKVSHKQSLSFEERYEAAFGQRAAIWAGTDGIAGNGRPDFKGGNTAHYDVSFHATESVYSLMTGAEYRNIPEDLEQKIAFEFDDWTLDSNQRWIGYPNKIDDITEFTLILDFDDEVNDIARAQGIRPPRGYDVEWEPMKRKRKNIMDIDVTLHDNTAVLRARNVRPNHYLGIIWTRPMKRK